MSHLPRVVPRKLRRHPSLSFFSPLNPLSRLAIVVSHRGGRLVSQPKWSIGEKRERSGDARVLFPRICSSDRGHQPSLLGRDGSGRFLIWQGVGLNGDGEGRKDGSLRGWPRTPWRPARSTSIFMDSSKCVRSFQMPFPIYVFLPRFPRYLTKPGLFRTVSIESFPCAYQLKSKIFIHD